MTDSASQSLVDRFIRNDGEPEPVCFNCDCYDGGRCINRLSAWFSFDPKPHDGCKRFFPDHKRWPEADHD